MASKMYLVGIVTNLSELQLANEFGSNGFFVIQIFCKLRKQLKRGAYFFVGGFRLSLAFYCNNLDALALLLALSALLLCL